MQSVDDGLTTDKRRSQKLSMSNFRSDELNKAIKRAQSGTTLFVHALSPIFPDQDSHHSLDPIEALLTILSLRGTWEMSLLFSRGCRRSPFTYRSTSTLLLAFTRCRMCRRTAPGKHNAIERNYTCVFKYNLD
ncbi:hypothetical protein DPMN_051432 [Dreissena polymorpha]|uniref:Uncharacterized protein n=1 Tax=Dreissena polymorpha TaxID=45954 RepID=A0A9D4CJY7_DREPO|nr:hypothetical protein DPMN_051432 [Dreissena polymorpha]